MEMVNLNLAHRWYIGYDLDEPVPDHSSLSKIRDRYGLKIYQLFFEQIVEQCIEAGLVRGEELYFDATKVRADANVNGMVEQTEAEAEQHLEELFPSNQDGDFSNLVVKYNGERITGSRKVYYRRVADEKISPTDPDATPMMPSKGGTAVLGYRDHYVVDGGKARIILSALVTPTSIMDNTPILDMVEWVSARWELQPEIALGESKYGTEHNIVGLESVGIKAYLPIPNLGKRRGFYATEIFQYDAEEDRYICSQGQFLPLHSSRKSEDKYIYRANAKICNAFPVKAECTNSKGGCHIFRSFYHDYLEKVR